MARIAATMRGARDSAWRFWTIRRYRPATPNTVIVVYLDASAWEGPKPTRPIIIIAEAPTEKTISDAAIEGRTRSGRQYHNLAANSATVESRRPTATAPPRSPASGPPIDASRYVAALMGCCRKASELGWCCGRW